MTGKFPTRLNSNKIAEIGINTVSTIFNDYFGWVFRRTHQEHDFGVDAYIDHVSKENCVTGRSIAAQVKTGMSYLSANGTMHWYRDTKEHLNYFLNLPVPIVLIVCDPESRSCWWAFLEKEKIDFQENGWRYPIPKSQLLDHGSKKDIECLFGSAEDHVSDFENEYQALSALDKDYFVQYSIPRQDIESKNTENLKAFINRISSSERLALSVQGRLYVSTYGYEADPREVHQIKEVREWAQKARQDIKSWYLCAKAAKWVPSTLIWIAACTCPIYKTKFKKRPNGKIGYQMTGSPKDLIEFMNECFYGLNEDSEKWGWSIKYNYDVSRAIQKELFPQIPFPPYKE